MVGLQAARDVRIVADGPVRTALECEADLRAALASGTAEDVRAAIEAGLEAEGAHYLVRAAEAGNGTAVMAKLLEAGVAAGGADEDGVYPLSAAAAQLDFAAVALLLEYGAGTACVEAFTGATPLLAAVNAADTDPDGDGASAAVVGMLLAHGADAAATDVTGWNALTRAAFLGKRATVAALLGAGADPNAADSHSWSGLAYASQKGYVAVAAALLKAGAGMEAACGPAIGGRRPTPLTLAARHGHSDVVGLLLAHGADLEAVDELGLSALMAAARHGHEAAVRQLLAAGADPDAAHGVSGATAVEYAAQWGHLGVVQAFLEERPAAASPGLAQALAHAARRTDLALVGVLLEAGVGVDGGRREGGTTLVMDAAFRGELDLLALLLQARPQVNAKNEPGMTALMLAAQRGHDGAAAALLAAGAYPNVRDCLEETALTHAARCGHDGVATLLLEAGADPDARSAAGVTPLLAAAQGGHRAAAGALLEAGADPTATDDSGDSALAAAHRTGLRELVAPWARLWVEKQRTDRRVSAPYVTPLSSRRRATAAHFAEAMHELHSPAHSQSPHSAQSRRSSRFSSASSSPSPSPNSPSSASPRPLRAARVLTASVHVPTLSPPPTPPPSGARRESFPRTRHSISIGSS